MDIHPSRLGLTATLEHKEEFRDYACKKGESYGIPYRILVPRKINGLLSAGRCVSADRKVFASLRVMPGCYITGMAAGMAAALAAETETPVRSINVTELQRRLKLTGAFLPNFAG